MFVDCYYRGIAKLIIGLKCESRKIELGTALQLRTGRTKASRDTIIFKWNRQSATFYTSLYNAPDEASTDIYKQ